MRKVLRTLKFSNSRGLRNFSVIQGRNLYFANSLIVVRHSFYIQLLALVNMSCAPTFIYKSVMEIRLRLIEIFINCAFWILRFWSRSKELILAMISKLDVSWIDLCFYIRSRLQIVSENGFLLFWRHLFNRLFVSQSIAIWRLRSYKTNW
jgi:hypothetical protein